MSVGTAKLISGPDLVMGNRPWSGTNHKTGPRGGQVKGGQVKEDGPSSASS